ncbi:MFS transporter [Prauserella endophytica]|uniref:MFS transporter n=1 Tax=Prauserella endophytica TaxID=1592324 RepID=A0ABY2S9E5_9PSEU|nr:MFS transporter [Prauserella endophytica]TKG71685.1 MFS transporter [Prauserella endophytica]
MSVHGTSGRRAGRREWLALGVLALPTMVLSMDLTVLHLAVPRLSADLAPSGAQLLWILDIYGFMVAGFLLLMGALGDRVGRRRLLMIGACCFAVVSVLAAFAPTAETLIIARALLGVAGATLMPSTLAVLTELFQVPAQRTFAVAVWMTAFIAGEAIGPLVGGVVLEFFWWGAVFLIGVPVMALLVLAGPVVLPETTERLAGRVDLTSAAMLLGAVLPLVFGIKSLAMEGFGGQTVVWVVSGVLLGVLFVRRQLRLDDPLMDPRLLRRPAFRAGLGTQILAVAAMAGSQLLVLQYVQTVLGLTPLQAGLATLPSVVLGIGANLLAPTVTRHVNAAHAIAAALCVAAVGAGILAAVTPLESLVWTMTGFTVLYIGVTPTLALLTDLIVSSAPSKRAGMASGVAESGAEFGLAAGMAFIGTAAMATYASRLVDMAPPGIDHADLRDAAETVGNGLAIAAGLPHETGGPLLEAISSAFTSGLQVAAIVSAVVLIVAAALTLRFPRASPTTTEPTGLR